MGDASTRGRHYAPPEPPTPSAESTSSPGRDENPEQPPKRARRAFLTQNACTRCRQKKSKCDGKRPTCGRCEKHTTECEYDVAQEGMTRMQSLQQQLEDRNSDFDQLQNLFHVMRNGSDQQATGLLARMRLGASVEDLLDVASGEGIPPYSLPDGSSSSQQTQDPYDSMRYTQDWAAGQPSEQASYGQQYGQPDPNAMQSPQYIREPPRPALDTYTPQYGQTYDHRDGYYTNVSPVESPAVSQRAGFEGAYWQGRGAMAPPQVPSQRAQGQSQSNPSGRRSSGQRPGERGGGTDPTTGRRRQP